MIDSSEILRASLTRHFGLYGKVLEDYIAGLLKCKNTLVMSQTIEELSKQHKGKRAPTIRTIKDAYFAVFESPEKKYSTLSDCQYCRNTGYVLGLYDYLLRIPIPNKQTLGPTDQIEKIVFECFCSRCQGKDLESTQVREQRILKCGWDSEELDKFLENCKKLASINA